MLERRITAFDGQGAADHFDSMRAGRRDFRWVISWRLIACLVGAGCSYARAATDHIAATSEPSCTFANPVASGQDPWVVKRDSVYYLVQSRARGIWVSRSSKLTEAAAGVRGVRVWSAPDTGWNRSNIWAPELHHLDGRWYIYYAAGRPGPAGAPFIHQRAGVLESASDDPQGGYVDRGMLYTGDSLGMADGGVWAIDLTVGRINGSLYAVWSGWTRNTTVGLTPQQLYIARMANPWTISSNRVQLTAPTESWERGTALDLQEGPEFLMRRGEVFIIYSTRESWLRHYKLGQLRLKNANADPMNPANYVKSGPVFSPAGDVYGVGHGSFTLAPDGTEDWIVYHAKKDTLPGWQRVIRLQKFGWGTDGAPVFGVPAPSGPLPAPAGECR
ncbi:MAG: hypothetical protein NVS1B4_21480 [Gemmatimonadaceae bacterium]